MDALPRSEAVYPTPAGAKTPKRCIPTTIKVGYRVIKIEDWEMRDGVSADRYGEFRSSANIIRVCTAYGWVKAANTLLHEILHAGYEEWNMAAGDSEERLVSALADGICTIWVDNPEVFVWIRDGIMSGDY